MGYLSKGYYIICSSPVFSFILYLVLTSLFWRTNIDWLYQIMLFTGMQILVIGVQVCGIVLCLVGYRRNESISSYIFLNILLITWGSLVVLWAMGWYLDLVRWSNLPDVRNLTIWDYMQYLTWALKGVIWIVSGLVFTVMSIWRKIKTDSPTHVTDD